jgi:hypothetical protein
MCRCILRLIPFFRRNYDFPRRWNVAKRRRSFLPSAGKVFSISHRFTTVTLAKFSFVLPQVINSMVNVASISTTLIDIIGVSIVIVIFVNFDIAIDIRREPFAVLFVSIVELQVFEPVFIRGVYRGNIVFTSTALTALEIRARSLEHGFLLLSVRR